MTSQPTSPCKFPSNDGHPRRHRVGETINGRYAVREQLAARNAGAVYSVFDEFLARPAVLKLYFSENARSRQQAEAQVAAGIFHPNVVATLDCDTIDESPFQFPFIVYEHVDGLPIDRFVTKYKLPLPSRLALFRSACHGVAELHRRGIMHRDVKPANMVVDATKNEVKIIDFGLARRTSTIAVPGELTVFEGTRQYAAPEQYDPGRSLTFSVDVYALGVSLYELLTDESPYRKRPADHNAWAAYVEQFATDQIELQLGDPALSAKLTSIIRRAMDKIPGNRGTVEDLIAAVNFVLSAAERPCKVV